MRYHFNQRVEYSTSNRFGMGRRRTRSGICEGVSIAERVVADALELGHLTGTHDLPQCPRVGGMRVVIGLVSLNKLLEG